MEKLSFANKAWNIFQQAVEQYHVHDDINKIPQNPFQEGGLEHLLFSKNWIDTVQWHLEDIIRDENIHPDEALIIKRKIDASNQKRTDLVEYIDAWFLSQYQDVALKENFRLNTETPAWAIDRLSILVLKVYHMNIEAHRQDASDEHRVACEEKLRILLLQKRDLIQSIDELLSAIEKGEVKMTVYKQMKMYNDESLNPILYQNKK
ncbi:DUF4254 domain-containing protein [Bergeyella zoohelcum]|uniref:DUF4254 domain-containing protein n=1 Tax=Bergeyella zoohelcum TaxID=1015 RepID=A0A380ZWC5_9FLAO|nr:DUF4254 domain-containing protein [Bergeyella zoohelcum]EKB60290.1 hypothetical protein HMPREF9700_01109 [Bergeyella zoohelcum CCUG 30536]SUV53029.1 Uncharacterised protein [Bergeyella zoohelcum]